MTPAARSNLIALALVVAVLAALPQALGSFHVFLLSRVIVYTIFALGVSLLWGYAGVLSFGQAFFFGLGAYAYALISVHYPEPVYSYLAFVLAIALPAAFALALGYYLFRGKVGGPFFAIITLALSLIGTQVAISWYDFTQGYNGIAGILPLLLPLPLLGDIDFGSATAYYYLLLALGVVAGLCAWRVVRSPLGRVLDAIRDNEDKVEAVGYNVAGYKAVTFAVSAAFAGIAGALYAPLAGIVSPPLLGFEFSTEVLIWVLVGGRRSLWGAFVGALAVSYLNSTLSTLFVGRELLLIGPLLVLMVLFLPEGLVGGLRSLAERWLAGVRARHERWRRSSRARA
jgi:urea ABC transporter permease protein UrtC